MAHIDRRRLFDPFYGEARRPCSPKSLYILADRYNLPDLKKKCTEKIVASLDHRNALWEVVSLISATFPELLAAETAALHRHWPKIPKAARKALGQHPNFQLVWTSFSDHIEAKEDEPSKQKAKAN